MASATLKHLALIHTLEERLGNISIALPEPATVSMNAVHPACAREHSFNIEQLLSEMDRATLTEVILGGDLD